MAATNVQPVGVNAAARHQSSPDDCRRTEYDDYKASSEGQSNEPEC